VRAWVALLLALLLLLAVAEVEEYVSVVSEVEFVTSPQGEDLPASLIEFPAVLAMQFIGYELSPVELLVPDFPEGYGSEDIVLGVSVNLTSTENTVEALVNRGLQVFPLVTGSEEGFLPAGSIIVVVEDRLGRELPVEVPINLSINNVTSLIVWARKAGARILINETTLVVVLRAPANVSTPYGTYVLYNSSTVEVVPLGQSLSFQYLIPTRFEDLSASNESGKLRVRGRLVDALGQPVPNRPVVIGSTVVRTDSNGYFEADPDSVEVRFLGDDVYLPSSATATVPVTPTAPAAPPTAPPAPAAPRPRAPAAVDYTALILIVMLLLIIIIIAAVVVLLRKRERGEEVVFYIK